MAAIGSALLLHGAGGGGWEWNAWSRVLRARGWRVSAPDLQPSAGGLGSTLLEDYLQQARAAGALLAQPLALVGASLGGLLALLAADALRPQAMLLLNPLPPAPLHARLPAWRRRAVDLADPAVVPWRRDASLAGTRAALPDADDAACLFAFRRWRDESRAVLDAARAGVAVRAPACPLRLLASVGDRDVPPGLSAEVAAALGGEVRLLAHASHVGPLLGRNAAQVALDAARWLEAACAGRVVKAVATQHPAG